jgi:hypothetical protein
MTFVGLPQMWQFAGLPQMWQFADLQFADPILFADLYLPQIRKNIIFLLTIMGLKLSDSNSY